MSSAGPGKNRPNDSPFKQQKLRAWQPILTPNWVVGTFLCIAIVFIPVGVVLLGASDDVVEKVVTYDDGDIAEDKWCNMNTNCTADNEEFQKVPVGQKRMITFTVDADMAKPVFVYYELENFYQNHRRYVKSRSDDQLRGVDNWMKEGAAYGWTENTKMGTAVTGSGAHPASDSVFSMCKPLVLPNHVESATCNWNTSTTAENGRVVPCKVMWPCGLIAGSFFNDVFTSVDDKWSEKGIAWQSDIDYKFKLPTKASAGWDYADEVAKEDSSYYYMLHQQYPNFPKLAEEGVQNEHFIVWMRTAGLPTFRKLYAKIDKDLKKGEKVEIEVMSQFNVTSFEGKKRLVLSTISWMGGKNSFLGIAYIIVGSVSAVLSIGFFLMDRIKPRKLGDTTYLVWKDGQ
jgi:hypothetical protein